MSVVIVVFFFFFNDTATTEIYTLSLHDALPICLQRVDGVPRLGPQLVLQDEQSGQLAVDGDERRGAAHPVSAALVGVGRRQAYGAGFHEAATTDQHVAAFDVDVDAEADLRHRRDGVRNAELPL